MKKIIIHYPYIPHYRLPIFTLLSNHHYLSFEFWADDSSGNKFLLTSTKGLAFKKARLIQLKIPIINKKIEWQPRVIKLMLTESMDMYIVMGGICSLTTWLSVIIAKFRKIPIFIWTHGYLKEETGVKNWIKKLFFKLDDGFLLYGNKAKQIMVNQGFSTKHLNVIYNSLDYETQKLFREQLNYIDRVNTRKKLNIEENAILLIAIGRIMSKLKLDQVISSLKYQNDNGHSTFLLIIGDGPEKKSLMQLAKSLKITKYIIFYGACHDEKELSKLYNASDYSVVMGKVGLAAMHSLAYGIPMITNNNLDEHFPEIEAVIEGKTGYYFKENDIKDFTSKLKPMAYRGYHYKECIKIIESKYTPQIQESLITKAILKYFKEKKYENK